MEKFAEFPFFTFHIGLGGRFGQLGATVGCIFVPKNEDQVLVVGIQLEGSDFGLVEVPQERGAALDLFDHGDQVRHNNSVVDLIREDPGDPS